MKNTIILSLLFSVFVSLSYAQKEKEDIIFRAMKDELDRNMSGLSLPDMQKPFFGAYTFRSERRFFLQAAYGGIESYRTPDPQESYRVDLLVGDYHRANNNFSSSSYTKGSQFGSLPLKPDYNEYRRALWLTTDNVYKNAAMEYNQKMTKWQQMNVTVEMENLDDFEKITPVRKRVPHRFEQKFGREDYWRKTLKEVSDVFTKYPDFFGSNASISIYTSDDYYLSSEGAEVIYPQDYTAFQIMVHLRTDDAIILTDMVSIECLNDEELPQADSLIRMAEQLAEKMLLLKDAPKVNEMYDGPVLFEGFQAALLLTPLLADRTGLVAYRPSLNENEFNQAMEDRIGRRVLPVNMTLKSIPGLMEYDGIPLTGSYEVDIEGVIPQKELLLVENGILRNVMNGRVPSLKTPHSTGNTRPGSRGLGISPGVLKFDVEEGTETPAQLKEKLLRLAKEEGLDYAYIVREGSWGHRSLYQVNLEDGKETLVRNGSFQAPGVKQLKKMTGISSENQVVNMRYNNIPVSMICPSAILLEDIEVSKDGVKGQNKKPVVSSPLKGKEQKKGKKDNRKNKK